MRPLVCSPSTGMSFGRALRGVGSSAVGGDTVEAHFRNAPVERLGPGTVHQHSGPDIQRWLSRARK